LHNEIQAFQNEIESILSDIEQYSGKILKDQSLQNRLRELFVTWNLSLKPSIASFVNQKEPIAQVDKLLEMVARDSGKRIHKHMFRNPLKNVLKILNVIYIEIVRTTSGSQNFQPQTSLRVFEEIPDLPDNFIPNALLGWKSKIKEFLKKYPFDQNVFIMIRYANQSANLIEQITMKIKTIDIDGRNLYPIVAKDYKITDDLNNPVACLLCCRYGIAVFDSALANPEFNPNVAYELAIMHFLKRQCLILKESSIKTMPADILHKLYEPFSSVSEAGEKVARWLTEVIS